MQEKSINRKSSKIIKLAQNCGTIILYFALNFKISFICFVENEVLAKVT
jgi:hypothetical protein